LTLKESFFVVNASKNRLPSKRNHMWLVLLSRGHAPSSVMSHDPAELLLVVFVDGRVVHAPFRKIAPLRRMAKRLSPMRAVAEGI
jgi:hypothetical protein